MINAFHDVRFPLAVSFGATGGPERINEIVQMVSGREKRNQRQAHSRRRYDAGTGIRAFDEIAEVMAFFEARRGSLCAFRFRDPFDMKSCAPGAVPSALDQLIGTGDGAATAFQLAKTYGDGPDAYVRPITKPVASGVRAAVDGVEVSGLAVDALTGILSFASPPPAGAEIRAGYEFDVAVRFDTDRLTVSLASFKAGQIPAIPLVEVL